MKYLELSRIVDKDDRTQMSRRHAALHTIFTRLSQGFSQGDWDIPGVTEAHDALAEEMEAAGLIHDSPLQTGEEDQSAHTRRDIAALLDADLNSLHGNLHSIFEDIKNGDVETGWNEAQARSEHEAVVLEMESRGMEHDSPLEG